MLPEKSVDAVSLIAAVNILLHYLLPAVPVPFPFEIHLIRIIKTLILDIFMVIAHHRRSLIPQRCYIMLARQRILFRIVSHISPERVGEINYRVDGLVHLVADMRGETQPLVVGHIGYILL